MIVLKSIFRNIEEELLSKSDVAELKDLVAGANHIPPQLEDIWKLIDKVWDEMKCDNENLDLVKINKFYSHPVWLLNGLFIEEHPLSIQHRNAISSWIINPKIMIKKLIDYGGGFGTLARMIAQKNPSIQIDIFEPNPTEYALARCRKFKNIRFISSTDKVSADRYDCLVSTDVLEHLIDPLRNLYEMISFVDRNRYLLIANNFHPVVKCHLPSTFHFRYTFNLFTRMMGLKREGPCQGSHAIIYKKIANHSPNWTALRNLEKISRLTFPILSKMGSLCSTVKMLRKKRNLQKIA